MKKDLSVISGIIIFIIGCIVGFYFERWFLDKPEMVESYREETSSKSISNSPQPEDDIECVICVPDESQSGPVDDLEIQNMY